MSIFYNAVSSSGIFQQHYELIVQDIIQYERFESILDVGAGPAWLLLELRKSLPDAALFGVDISAAMVAIAERNLRRAEQHDRIVLEVGSAEDLPYSDESFDCVISTGSLHHWENPITGLNEIHRVLHKGHSAYIYDLVRSLPKDTAREVTRRFGLFRSSLLWLHSLEEPFLDADEMLSLAGNSHFHTATIRYVGALCCMIVEKR